MNIISTLYLDDTSKEQAYRFSDIINRESNKTQMVNAIKRLKASTFTSLLKEQVNQLKAGVHYNVLATELFTKIGYSYPSLAEMSEKGIEAHLSKMGACRPAQFGKWLNNLRTAGNDTPLAQICEDIVVRTTKYVFKDGQFIREKHLYITFDPTSDDRLTEAFWKSQACQLLSHEGSSGKEYLRQIIKDMEVYVMDRPDSKQVIVNVQKAMIKLLGTLDGVAYGYVPVLIQEDTLCIA